MNNFVIIYIDDILVYFKIAGEHVQHLEVMLRKLRDNKIFANGEKRNFVQLEIEFLGHVISCNGFKTKMKKVMAIWKSTWPSKKMGLQAFLGLENFYWRFMCNFSKIAKPLYNLLKKRIIQVWSEFCYQGIEEFKNKLSTPLVQKFPKFDKPL